MKQSPAILAASLAPGSPKALDYAPGPPTRRHRWSRRLLLALFLLGFAFAARRWGREAFDRAAFLYHQRACMNYAAPADQVVFDSDPIHAAALAKDPNFVISSGCAFRRSPSDWQPLKVVPAWMPPMQQAMIFLHERHAAGGTPRIVALERDAGPDCLAFYASVLEPAGIRRPLKSVPCGMSSNVGDTDTHADTRFYAGQPDAVDPSHFTIRYERAGVTHMIDGYLRADNSIDLIQRREAADGPE